MDTKKIVKRIRELQRAEHNILDSIIEHRSTKRNTHKRQEVMRIKKEIERLRTKLSKITTGLNKAGFPTD